MKRSDRTGTGRTSYEKNRQVILKTQDICGICGMPVDFSYKSPHPLSPTVDHIVPVSKGGHPYDLSNLQLAHRWCNRWKSDKTMDAKFRFGDKEEEIDNRNLPQHFDWANYKAKDDNRGEETPQA